MSGTSATRRIVITRPAGLHARPCLAIASTVRRYRSKVEIRYGCQTVDAHDVLQLLSLGATQGAELTISAHGPDADEVLEALGCLSADDFGLSPAPS